MNRETLIKKMICFPAPGSKLLFPYIVYTDGPPTASGYYPGNKDRDQLIAGRRGWYLASRIIKFTPKAWELCEDYIKRKKAFIAEYKKLQRIAKQA